MKRNKKSKMSCINKTSFKRHINSIRRKKNPRCLASQIFNKYVNNCTIHKLETSVKNAGEWNIPEEGYKQPKKIIYLKKVFPNSYKLNKLTEEDYREKLINHKMKRWERKHPKPVNTESVEKDLFEEQFIKQWEADKELALTRIRDFVVSMYDKLPLIGRFEKSEGKYEEKIIATIKDKRREGSSINELNPDKSPLLKKAKEITNKAKQKCPKLVVTNIKDHNKKRGRLILPKAALLKRLRTFTQLGVSFMVRIHSTHNSIN